MALFERGGLEQDSGLLRERWQQEGSDLVNVAHDNASDEVVYTVTSGKTLYVSYITVLGSAASDAVFIDNGAGGTKRFFAAFPTANESYSFSIYPPIAFDTNVYVLVGGAGSADVVVSGWEE